MNIIQQSIKYFILLPMFYVYKQLEMLLESGETVGEMINRSKKHFYSVFDLQNCRGRKYMHVCVRC